jgi:parallel beta-helix repeat protein
MSKRRPKTFRFAPGRRRASYSPRVEAVESRTLLAVFSVTSAADNGLGTNPGSLSWAITQVNLDTKPEVDTIDFNIPGTGPFTITPASPLPNLSHPAFIDGESQPGYSGAPIIQIQGPGNNPVEDGLTLAAGSDGSTISGLCISGFGGGAGILIRSSSNLIQSNYLGTDITGQTSQPNGSGVLMTGGAKDNTVGGTSAGSTNIISGNTNNGVHIQGSSGTNTSNNTIEGNLIGTNTSDLPLGDNVGVLVDNEPRATPSVPGT